MSVTSLMSTSPTGHETMASLLPSPPASLAKASAERFLREHKVCGMSTKRKEESAENETTSKKARVEEDPLEGGSEAQNTEQKKPAVVEQPPEEVAGFVRTLFTLLRVCDPAVVSWSEDGTAMLIHEPSRFAGEICPKFFRHRNFNSFTRLLNMYQFHKVPGNGRDKAVTFVHPSFRRGRDDLLCKIQRKGSSAAADKDDAGSKRRAKDASQNAKSAAAKKVAANKAAPAATAGDDKKARRAPSIFPSAAHYRAAAGTPEALIGRDVWERTNAEITELEKRSGYLSQSTVGGSSAVSTWMRRVVELEREARALKAENERLRAVEVEVDQLRSQLQAQTELITQIQLIDSTFQHHQPHDDDSALWQHVMNQDADPNAASSSDLSSAIDDTATADSIVHLLSKALQQHQPDAAAPAPPADPSTAGEHCFDPVHQPDLSGALALLQQQHPNLASADHQPKLDMATLMNEPFTAQCLAQCLAMTGALPSTAPPA